MQPTSPSITLTETSDNYPDRGGDLGSLDHSVLLFNEICNQMELDRAWLTEEPRHETTLLFRYFVNKVRRVKDLLEYRDLVHECLSAIKVQDRI